MEVTPQRHPYAKGSRLAGAERADLLTRHTVYRSLMHSVYRHICPGIRVRSWPRISHGRDFSTERERASSRSFAIPIVTRFIIQPVSREPRGSAGHPQSSFGEPLWDSIIEVLDIYFHFFFPSDQ